MNEDPLTEADWYRPLTMKRALSAIDHDLSPRKARLLACATARTSSRFGRDRGLQAVLAIAFEIADGHDVVRHSFVEDTHGRGFWFEFAELGRDKICGLIDEPFDLTYFIRQFEEMFKDRRGYLPNETCVHRLVRDIFGNPFRPVAFDPRWRTSDTVGLARAIYDDRAFDRLPILADALMDAGCEDEQIISHCRSEGPHVRGCWVVDLVLGKE